MLEPCLRDNPAGMHGSRGQQAHLCVDTGMDYLHLCGNWLGPLICQCAANGRCPEDACSRATGWVNINKDTAGQQAETAH